MWKKMPHTDIMCYQIKPQESGMGYIFLRDWPKGCHRLSQILQNIAIAVGSSTQPDGKTLFLKTSYTYVIKHGENELVPNWKLHSY